MVYVVRAIHVDWVTGTYTVEKNTLREAKKSAKSLREQGLWVIIIGPDGKPLDETKEDEWTFHFNGDELAKPVPCHVPVNSLWNNEGKSVVKVGRRHAGKLGVGVIAPRMRTQKIIDEASHWRDQAVGSLVLRPPLVKSASRLRFDIASLPPHGWWCLGTAS
jgi:hypothetical protein